MCEPHPGPKCATHAARDRDRALRRSRAAQAAYATARAAADAADEAVARLEGMTTGEQDTAAAEVLSAALLPNAVANQSEAHHALRQAREVAVAARRDAEAARRVWEATPTGIASLEATTGAPGSTPRERATARARLSVARHRAAAIDQAWRASSAYVEQRITRARTTTADPTLAVDLRDARCAEHGTIPPPTHPKARAAWEDTADGKDWAALHALVGESADLTFMLPQVRSAGDDTTRVAAHWAAVPARWVPDRADALMARAAGTGTPWAPEPSDLVAAVSASGQPLVAKRGAFHGGGTSDTWHAAPVTGPVAAPTTGTVHDQGWVAVRDKDSQVRFLTDLGRFRPVSA